MVLATAPAGIAEMVLTGKVLGLSGERVRLIEREALRKLRDSDIIAAAATL
jgi:DNA-directed RNA polymerase sigma subunit (sigma70/sigma32)